MYSEWKIVCHAVFLTSLSLLPFPGLSDTPTTVLAYKMSINVVFYKPLIMLHGAHDVEVWRTSGKQNVFTHPPEYCDQTKHVVHPFRLLLSSFLTIAQPGRIVFRAFLELFCSLTLCLVVSKIEPGIKTRYGLVRPTGNLALFTNMHLSYYRQVDFSPLEPRFCSVVKKNWVQRFLTGKAPQLGIYKSIVVRSLVP